MHGPGFKQKKITLSVSLVTYQQIQELADKKNVMVSDYVRKLVIQHLVDLGLPIYYSGGIDVEKETWDAGQE